jgi:hypothetical protein
LKVISGELRRNLGLWSLQSRHRSKHYQESI